MNKTSTPPSHRERRKTLHSYERQGVTIGMDYSGCAIPAIRRSGKDVLAYWNAENAISKRR